MTVTLDKFDLITLVMGSYAPFNKMEEWTAKDYGNYTGGHEDKWDWNRGPLLTASNEELWAIYLECKTYWENV